MLIKVLGPGCAKCKEVEKLINVVVQESGSSAKVEKVTDFKEMMALGVMSTPAVQNRAIMLRGLHRRSPIARRGGKCCLSRSRQKYGVP